MQWLKGLDEYYQPPDPPPFVPGDISWAEELALDIFLDWYDDALDFEDLIEAIKKGDEQYFTLKPDLQTVEDELSGLISGAAKQIAKRAAPKNSKYNTTLDRLIGTCDAYIEFTRKDLVRDHNKIADRMEELIMTLHNLKGK